MSERILSKAEFATRKGISEDTLERQENAARAAGDTSFPPRRIIGRGRIGYLESDVDAHLRSLPIGRLAERAAPAIAGTRRRAARLRAEKKVAPEAPDARGTEEEGPHVP